MSVTISSFGLSHLREVVQVQERVRREFVIEEETRKRAEAYAQKLFCDFGLNRSGMDTYRHVGAASDEKGV